MIDAKTSEAIINTIGIKHLLKIGEFAKEKGFAFAENYTEKSLPVMIRYVLSGERENHEIESAIIQCAEHYHKIKKENEKKIKKLSKKLMA